MATNAQARTISASAASNKGILDITSLVLLAILLAAGFILNMTVGNALAVTGIKPQFIIAAYALAIALTQASFAQAAIFGILSAAVIQITTSSPSSPSLINASIWSSDNSLRLRLTSPAWAIRITPPAPLTAATTS